MANRRYIDFPIASTSGDTDIILIWQDGVNKQTTKATFLSGLPENLDELNDVAISGLTNGQILRYDSTTGKWENTDQGNLDLNDLNDVSIVSPSNGQVLVYNSSTSKWENSSGGFVPYVGAVTTVNLGAQTIQAGQFVKAGGTASQFLKADGSIDSTAYGTGSVTSVGLTMPSAFNVANSPITSAGTLAVTGAGTVSQYIRGDGSLADFPSASGGGSSVSYYLNGSVNQGTIGGVAYKELSKVPVLGTGTDFTINANGYIASFLTDAGDPNLLEIPGGNWNFETYFSASSGGGTPTFYVELYKYNGTTFTLLASNSGSPELIAFGTTLTSYFSTLAVPTTTLALTDRLAIRYYVTHSGRTITLHTEDNHLCQVITTFTTGLTAINGLTAQVQNFAVGTSGSDFNIASATATHTFNLPTASATNRGALSSADWTTFNNKENAITAGTTAQYFRGDKTFQTLNTSVVPELSNLYYTEARVNANANVAANTAARHNAVTLGTANGLSLSTQVLSLGLASAGVTGALSGTDWTTFNNKASTAQLANYLPLAGGTLTGQLNGTIISLSSDITANKYRGVNSLVLNTYTTVNPSSNVYLYSPGNDRDAWIYLDSADTGSNWGIYHRQIDSPVAGLPGNSIGFIGGGANTLQSYINILNGDAYFRGNVGIGTASPGQKLQVDGGSLLVNSGTSATAYRDIMMGGISGWSTGESHGIDTVYNTAASPTTFSRIESHFDGTSGRIRFRNLFFNSAPRTDILMTIEGSGNVLIGTTTDNGARLQVSGASTFSSTMTSEGTFFGKLNAVYQNSSTNILNVGTDQSMYGGTNSDGGVFVYGNNSLHLSTNSVRRLTINGSGNVGIGTASPGQALDVYRDSSVASYIVGRNGSGVQTAIGVAGDNGSLLGTLSNHNLRIVTNGAVVATITNSGNVGIGTSSPGQKLSVQGEIAKYCSLSGVDGNFENLIKYGFPADLQSGTGAANRWVGIDGTITAGASVINTLRIRAYPGTTGNLAPVNVADFRGDQSSIFYGNLGIGTTSPASPIHVQRVNDGVIGTFRGTSNAQLLLSISGGNLIYDSSNGNAAHVWQSNTAERMRIAAGGNVLIGTTTDSGDRVNVNGSIRVPQTFFFRYDGDTGIFGSATSITGGSASQLGIRAASDILFATNGANERMRITSGGNVGIGTSSPVARLEVTGLSASPNNGFFVTTNSYTSLSSGSVLRIGHVASSGNTTAIIQNLTVGGTTVGNIAIPDGNLLIGTTTDGGQRLQVEGGKGLVRTTDSGWGQFAVANPNDAEVGIVWAANGSGYPGVTSTYTRQWIAGINPFGTGMDRWSLTNRTLGANTAITVVDNGNVLIGSTTDNGTKLQVNGAIRTAQPVGTTSNGWLLGRALISGTSTPNRWIRVQIGLEYYDILAVYMGTL